MLAGASSTSMTVFFASPSAIIGLPHGQMTLLGNAAQFRSRAIEVEFQHRIAKIVQATRIHCSGKRTRNLINRLGCITVIGLDQRHESSNGAGGSLGIESHHRLWRVDRAAESLTYRVHLRQQR